MPIYALIGGAAVILFLVQGDSPANAIIGSYDQLTSTDLPAIPLFTLAGFLLAEGHASDRLLRLFRAFFGWAPGGTAVVTAILCAFFTLLTGGSGVTILALGGLLLPALLADGYRERFSLGLLTAAGSLGLLFPPSLPLILYGIVAEVPIGDLFVGGFLPGVLMLGALAALGVREGLGPAAPASPFTIREAAAATWSAKWELMLPVVIIASLLGGATTVQSAALAALFTLIVQRFIQRDLAGFADLRRAMSHSIALVGGILIILAVAVGFTTYLIDAQVPARLAEWTQGERRVEMGVSARLERLPDHRRRPDGHLLVDHRRRAAHRADRRSTSRSTRSTSASSSSPTPSWAISRRLWARICSWRRIDSTSPSSTSRGRCCRCTHTAHRRAAHHVRALADDWACFSDDQSDRLRIDDGTDYETPPLSL